MVNVGEVWEEMIPEGLRGEAEAFVVRFVGRSFRGTNDIPSVDLICRAVEKEFNLERVIAPDIIGEKGLFLDGMLEICEKAEVPKSAVAERLARTRGATEKRLRMAGKKALEGVEKRTPLVPEPELADKELRGLVEERKREEAEQELAEWKVSERKRIREAKRRKLIAKARLDPRKIADYIRFTDPEWTEELEAFCKGEGTTLKSVCKKLSEENPPFKDEENYDSYVKDLLHDLDLKRRKAEIRKKYGSTLDLHCECGLLYEHREEELIDETGNVAFHYSSLICPLHKKGPPYFCPFCRELNDRTVYLVYDAKNQTMRCQVCGESWKVKQPLYPVGTLLGGEKPLSLQEQRDAAAFVGAVKEQGRSLHQTMENFRKWHWSLENTKQAREEEERKLRRVQSDIKEYRDLLKDILNATSGKTNEYKRLEERIKELKGEKEKLQGEIPPLEAKYMERVRAQAEAEYEKQSKPYHEELKKLEEQIKEKTAVKEQIEKGVETLRQKKDKVEGESREYEDAIKRYKSLIKDYDEKVQELHGELEEAKMRIRPLLTAKVIFDFLRGSPVNRRELTALIYDLTQLERNPDKAMGELSVYLPQNVNYKSVREMLKRILTKYSAQG